MGAGIFLDLLSIGQIKLGTGLPLLQKSILGWIVSGSITIQEETLNRKISQCTFSSTIDKIDKQLEEFWRIEELESSKPWSQEEISCESFFSETTFRDPDGRLVVKLPMKMKKEVLGDSLQIATKRFLNLERKLVKNDTMYETYKDFMKEYEDLGHMTKIKVDDLKNNIAYYLPHHAVIREASTTTKLRVVFDASAKTTSHLSLNDILLVGPTIQEDIISILCRFRQHNYAITSDIAKMYRQVLVNEEDRDLQESYGDLVTVNSWNITS